MQTIEALRKAVAYDGWANLAVLRGMDTAPETKPAIRLFAHVVTAEQEWLLRLTAGKDSTGVNFWPELSLQASRERAAEVHEAYVRFLGGLTEEELERVATYRNSAGIEFRTGWRDILTHVLNHSTYHRGQIATTLREAGATPAATDYIVYIREQAAPAAKGGR